MSELKTKEEIVKPFIYIDGEIPAIEVKDCYNCMEIYSSQQSEVMAKEFAEWLANNYKPTICNGVVVN